MVLDNRKKLAKECFNHVDRVNVEIILSIDDEQKENIKHVATLLGSNQKFDKNCKGFDRDKCKK